MTTEISDEFMRDMLTKSRAYSLVLLKAGPKRNVDDVDATVWEHARRNFALRADGTLVIVCPITDDGEWRGIGIFDATPEEVTALMDGDPGVQTGVFEYEVHPVRSFPGDALP
jgi:hypothetical protein